MLAISPAHAVVKTGTKCTEHKATMIIKSMKYTCVKNGNKLVWSKGVPVKKVAALKQGVCPSMASADKDLGITQLRARTLISMNENQAEECANKLGWIFRVGQRDDESFALTRDYRIDRVTVSVMQGFITTVDIG